MYKQVTKKESPMKNIRKRAGKVNEEMSLKLLYNFAHLIWADSLRYIKERSL
jgi:hypothetical protein